jgi:hypothetical protein
MENKKRNVKLQILFKANGHKNKMWNAPKGVWVNKQGKEIPRPKWTGQNAFVADTTKLGCLDLEMERKGPFASTMVAFEARMEESAKVVVKVAFQNAVEGEMVSI